MQPTPSSGLPARTVLVVDDKAENRDLIRAYLETHYRILEADSGQMALEIVTQEAPDLVLLDVMMPGLSGLAVCRQIKKNAGPTFMPVLLLTALNAQEDRNAGLAAGADDFLTKPVDRRELELRVRAFLKLREQEELIRRQVDELCELGALKDDLVSLIVHDLRNPLTTLLLHLDALGHQLDDPKLKTGIVAALRSADRLREAVDDLLEVRLLEEGQVRLQLESLSVGEVIQDAVTTLDGASKKSGVAVDIGNESEASVTLDRRLVRRSVENLISNALKYSPKDGVVTVRVRDVAEGVEIEVSDRGPGIPDELKAHVFEKFGSVESSRGVARRGYGLGLYMVRLVVDLHGGKVTVHDQAEGGTRFSVILPLQECAAELQLERV